MPNKLKNNLAQNLKQCSAVNQSAQEPPKPSASPPPPETAAVGLAGGVGARHLQPVLGRPLEAGRQWRPFERRAGNVRMAARHGTAHRYRRLAGAAPFAAAIEPTGSRQPFGRGPPNHLTPSARPHAKQPGQPSHRAPISHTSRQLSAGALSNDPRPGAVPPF